MSERAGLELVAAVELGQRCELSETSDDAGAILDDGGSSSANGRANAGVGGHEAAHLLPVRDLDANAGVADHEAALA